MIIKIFSSRTEAEVAKSALSANNIDAYIEADDAGGMYPFPLSPTADRVRLIVAEKNAKKARSVLDMI